MDLMQAIELTWSVFAHLVNTGTVAWRSFRNGLSTTHPALMNLVPQLKASVVLDSPSWCGRLLLSGNGMVLWKAERRFDHPHNI